MVFPASPISVASNSPMTKATRYVDIFMESTNVVSTLLSPTSFSERTFSLLTRKYFLSATMLIEKTALYSGSSQQGKAFLAEVGSN